MDQISAFCMDYEQKIEDLGGLDIQLLGIGSNGHIGFNEPGSLIDSKTRLIALNHTTRAAAASDFGGLSSTPKKGITLGVKVIMNAPRSEERRVGKECVSTCRSRWSPYH